MNCDLIRKKSCSIHFDDLSVADNTLNYYCCERCVDLCVTSILQSSFSNRCAPLILLHTQQNILTHPPGSVLFTINLFCRESESKVGSTRFGDLWREKFGAQISFVCS